MYKMYRVSTYFRLALVRLSKTVGYGGLVFPKSVKERRPGGKRGRRGRDHCEVQDNLTKKYGLTEEIYQKNLHCTIIKHINLTSLVQ